MPITTQTPTKSLATTTLATILGASLLCSLAFGAKDPNKTYKSVKSQQSFFYQKFRKRLLSSLAPPMAAQAKTPHAAGIYSTKQVLAALTRL